MSRERRDFLAAAFGASALGAATAVLGDSRQADFAAGWYYVELFGHSQVAGYVSVTTVGQAAMLKVEPPGMLPMYVGLGAVFTVRATTQKWCEQWAKHCWGSWRLADIPLRAELPRSWRDEYDDTPF